MKIKYNNYLICQKAYKESKKDRGIFFYLAYDLKKEYSNIYIINIDRTKYSNDLCLSISNNNNEYIKVNNYLEKIVVINVKKKILFEKTIYDYPEFYSLFKKYQKYYLNIIIT